MSHFISTAEDQLVFLDKIQQLLSEGDFTATYKFSLLQALADLSVEKKAAADGTLELAITEIAEKIVGYYWSHTLPYLPVDQRLEPTVLQQNTGGQATIITQVKIFQESQAANLYQARKLKPWATLVKKVARVVNTMPLWKLQTVGDISAPLVFLYENTGGTVDEINLFPGVAHSFRHFHSLITNLIQSAWILQIHRIKRNQPVLGKQGDLRDFLFGSERNNLEIYRPVLTDIQHNHCFYCHKPIKDKGEVDHFIPWSRYPLDLGHNFVLAHKSCNSSKSDFLASNFHLANWSERNTLHDKSLSQAFDALSIESDLHASKHIAYWAYEQVDHSSGLVWAKKKSLCKLEPGWQSLLV